MTTCISLLCQVEQKETLPEGESRQNSPTIVKMPTPNPRLAVPPRLVYVQYTYVPDFDFDS